MQHFGLVMADTTLLSPLNRADGSAEFSKAGYSVIAAVNGPVEVQRRDELPEEAAVDVAVRPAAGVGGFDHPRILLQTMNICSCRFRATGKASRIHYSKHSTPYHTSLSAPTHSDPSHAADPQQPSR